MSMKKRRGVLLVLCAVLVLMCSAGFLLAVGSEPVFAADVEPAEYEQLADSYEGKTVLIQTNDVHGAVDNYQYVAGLRDELVRRKADVYLIDVGDFMQGDIYVAWDKGCSAVNIMNEAGYELATIGNHEFDYGFVDFKSNLKAAKFQIICNNLIEDAYQEQVFQDTYVIKNGDLEIGFFGVDTPSTKTESAPSNTEGLTFLDGRTVPTIYKKAADDVNALKKDGADIVIGLTHLGVSPSSEPYRSYDLWGQLNTMNALPDFILDGHSHTVMSEGLKGEPIMQTGTKLANVGIVVIDEKSEKIEKNFLYKVEDIQSSGWSNKNVQTLTDEIKKEVDDLYDQTVCSSEVELNGTKDKKDAEAQGKPYTNGNRDGETNLGDLSADAFAAEALRRIQSGEISDIDADHVVGFVNGGGIRASIGTGDVSKKDILSVFPWSNTVFGVYVKGSELLEVLEASAFASPASDGGFPQISGLDYTIDTRYEYYPRKETYPASTYYGPEEIRRVKINDVNGKAFSKTDTYLVMTNSFCASGGNACFVLGNAKKRFDTGVADADSLVSYVTGELGGVIGQEYADPAGSGHIKIVTGAKKKSTNTMIVRASDKTVSYTKVRKADQVVKPFTVKKAVGRVTYKKKSGSYRLTIDKKTGEVTVKRGTKKGIYEMTVQVTATGSRYYSSKTRTVKTKIKVS